MYIVYFIQESRYHISYNHKVRFYDSKNVTKDNITGNKYIFVTSSPLLTPFIWYTSVKAYVIYSPTYHNLN